MSEAEGAPAAPMMGGGAYNKNSGLQRANLFSAIPLLELAARSIPAPGPRLVIVDYGCAQGLSSMRPVAAALDVLGSRLPADAEVMIVHTDLPGNEFASLFTLLRDSPDSYVRERARLYPVAMGRSYFDPLLPAASVDLGWSSNALHWLSRNAVEVADHGWAIFSADADARHRTVALLDEDWRRFLRARGHEMKPGARLVCQFLAHGPEAHGFEWMAGLFWKSIVAVAAEWGVTEAELRRMTCPSAGRTLAQIEAPFAGGSFAGMTIAHLQLVEAPDPYWAQYEQDGDAHRLGLAWANMMRAANGPNFIAGLAPERDGVAFLDAVTEMLAGRVAAAPEKSRSYNAHIVLERAG